MANPAPPAPPAPGTALIAEQYSIDMHRPLAPVGGLSAFGVINHRSGVSDLMAVQVQRRLPVRVRALQALATPIDGLLTPLAHGAVPVPGPEDSYYLICPAPPGLSLMTSLRVWPELELLECVLRPVALVLENLQARGITHRGIRPDNVFQHHPGVPVVLGMAWAGPPALAQPALFEPPYSAMCLPVARGEGTIADDVYALGVLLICLALGRVPLAHLDEAAIIRRKLEMGSFAAIAGDEHLPPIIADLARGMLAEDPEHRPHPMLLLDPASARGRRVAARAPRRAQRPIVMGGSEIWTARLLGHAMALEPEQALHALRGGGIVHWLRRALGDGVLAARLEEVLRHRLAEAGSEDIAGDPVLVMRAIALLDPLAPLCWRGIALWPDGIGAALAAAEDSDPEVMARLEELITLEVVALWAVLRPDRCDAGMLRVEARQQHSWLQVRGSVGAAGRLTYLMNGLLPCASPLMQGRWVARLSELLPTLELAAGRVDRTQTAPLDGHVAAFLAARSERHLDSELRALGGTEEVACIMQLKLLAQLQSRQHAAPLPGLAMWFADRAGPIIATWRNRKRRVAIGEQLRAMASTGHLAPMLGLVEDAVERTIDANEAQVAVRQLDLINAELTQITLGAKARAVTAYRLGQEIAAGAGLAALAAMLVAAALE